MAKGMADRLVLLKAGRGPYLDFLRNLTPQILLLSFVVLTVQKLDFTRSAFQNLTPTLIIFVLLVACGLAVYANCAAFYMACFKRHATWACRVKAGLRRDRSNWRLIPAIVMSIWKRRFIECLEMFFLYLVLQIVFVAVVSSATISAANVIAATQTRANASHQQTPSATVVKPDLAGQDATRHAATGD